MLLLGSQRSMLREGEGGSEHCLDKYTTRTLGLKMALDVDV